MNEIYCFYLSIMATIFAFIIILKFLSKKNLYTKQRLSINIKNSFNFNYESEEKKEEEEEEIII